MSTGRIIAYSSQEVKHIPHGPSVVPWCGILEWSMNVQLMVALVVSLVVDWLGFSAKHVNAHYMKKTETEKNGKEWTTTIDTCTYMCWNLPHFNINSTNMLVPQCWSKFVPNQHRKHAALPRISYNTHHVDVCCASICNCQPIVNLACPFQPCKQWCRAKHLSVSRHKLHE